MAFVAGITAALGSAIVGGFSAVGLSGAFVTGLSSVLSTAIVGAGIGALSSAVMGGDIGKGALYGAIGGAVTGGFSVMTDGAVYSAVKSGAEAMNTMGFTEGVKSGWNAAIDASSGVSSATNEFSQDAAGGPVPEGVTDFTVNTAKDGGASALGGGLIKGLTSGDNTGEIAGAALTGGLQWYGQKEAIDASDDRWKEELAWRKETYPQDRQDSIDALDKRLAAEMEMAAGSNETRLASVEMQNAHDDKMWDKAQAAEDDRRAEYSASVTGASKSFKADTGQIKSFMNKPPWLLSASPGGTPSSPGQAQQVVPSQQMSEQQAIPPQGQAGNNQSAAPQQAQQHPQQQNIIP